MRAFTSEWVKLSRRTTLVGFGGTMIGLTQLITILAFERAAVETPTWMAVDPKR